MKPHEEHRKEAQRRLKVRIITVSTSRYSMKESGQKFTDGAGDAAEIEVRSAGHSVAYRALVSDDPTMLRREVKGFLSSGDDVILFAGGTGLSPRDVTVESIRPFFEKELLGFGELVRRLGYDEVGTAAILTRSTSGIAKGKLILCMPGSPDAVKTALKAFAGEFAHALFVARS